MGGNTPCRRKASDSSDPFFTSSRTLRMWRPSLASVSRSASRSSAFRIGRPARTSVTNCWLKIRNLSRLIFFLRPPPTETPAISWRGLME